MAISTYKNPISGEFGDGFAGVTISCLIGQYHSIRKVSGLINPGFAFM
jgi:hypothetical protein